jgi:hypothetical protein
MRKLTRRPELTPAGRQSVPRKTDFSDDDRMFINTLKKHHRKQKFQYMREWWEKFKND